MCCSGSLAPTDPTRHATASTSYSLNGRYFKTSSLLNSGITASTFIVFVAEYVNTESSYFLFPWVAETTLGVNATWGIMVLLIKSLLVAETLNISTVLLSPSAKDSFCDKKVIVLVS